MSHVLRGDMVPGNSNLFNGWPPSTPSGGSQITNDVEMETYEETNVLNCFGTGTMPMVKREPLSPTPGDLGGPRSIPDIKPHIQQLEGSVATARDQGTAAEPEEAVRSNWWYDVGVYSDNLTRVNRAESDVDDDVDVDDDADDGSERESKVRAAQRRCEDCGAVCTSDAHQLLHRCRNRTFECVREVDGKPCGWQSRSRLQLRDHELQAHSKPHACGVCGARFASVGWLRRHAAAHAPSQTEATIKEATRSEATTTTTCACDQCGARFTRQTYLSLHKTQCAAPRAPTAVVTLSDRAVDAVDTKPFVCKLCLAAFWHHRDVQRHVDTAHTLQHAFKCTVCVASFPKQRALAYHMKVHRVPRPFTCSVCFLRFVHREELMQHLQVHLAASNGASKSAGVAGLTAAAIKKELGEDDAARRRPKVEAGQWLGAGAVLKADASSDSESQ